MLIIKRTFSDFIRERASYPTLDEMAIAPTKFKNPKTGKLEGDYHVNSNNPVFMDKYDIYYLYQFPPNNWTEALYQRYNYYLFKGKKEGEHYSDIQDIAISGHRGQKIIFHNRNTFIHHLLDKIERAVDVDYLRKSHKTPEARQEYERLSDEHKQKGRDLGGYVGATLADPREKEVETTDKKGKTSKEKIYVARGFMGMDKSSLTKIVTDWMQGSSEGWLKDLDKVSHNKTKVSRGGGRGGAQEFATFSGSSLSSIESQMKAAGAVPFKVVGGNRVMWPDVTVGSEHLSFYAGTANSDTGANLPVLFPGKSIDNKAVKAHEADKEFLNKINNFQQADFEKMNQNIEEEARKLREDIERRDVQAKWETEDPEDSVEREKMEEKLRELENLAQFKTWFKQNHPGQPMNPTTLQSVVGDYAKVIENQMKHRKNNADKYGPYEWAVHRYNRSREPHDPLGVGVSNPLFLGRQKYKGMRDKTIRFGNMWPNRQSKDMLHAEPGHWEDHFKDTFGSQFNDRGQAVSKSHLNDDDYNELSKAVHEYFGKIQQKLAGDKDVLAFFGNPQELQMAMMTADNFRKALKTKVPDLKTDSSGKIPMNDTRIPNLVKSAYNEIRVTEKELSRVGSETSSGLTSTSAIADGVDNFLRKRLAYDPELQSAMESMKAEIILNAENYVRRTAGDSAFKNYKEIIDSKKGGVEKHQAANDLRAFVAEKANNYVATLAQLNLGIVDTRRLRKGRSLSADAQMGTGDSTTNIASGISTDDQANRIDQRVVDEITTNPKNLDQLEKSLFATGEKRAAYRRYRQASDSSAGIIGHNVEAMYSLIDKAHKRGDQGVETFEKKLDVEPTTDEINMIHKLSGAITYFQLFKALMTKDALQKGQPVNDRDINKLAREKTIATLKKQRLITPENDPDQNTQQAAVQSFKSRVDDDKELDAAEQQAAKIISSWEGLQPQQLQQKLQQLRGSAGLNNVSDEHKTIIDLILVYHNQQPVGDTFAPASMAATSATGGALPDIELPADKQKRMVAKIQKVQADIRRLMGNAKRPSVITNVPHIIDNAPQQ